MTLLFGRPVVLIDVPAAEQPNIRFTDWSALIGGIRMSKRATGTAVERKMRRTEEAETRRVLAAYAKDTPAGRNTVPDLQRALGIARLMARDDVRGLRLSIDWNTLLVGLLKLVVSAVADSVSGDMTKPGTPLRKARRKARRR